MESASDPSREELHIASVVVHATPRRAPLIAEAIAAMGGAQVHARTDGGKLVVTLEADSASAMTGSVSRIQHLDGVLSVALVYQCADSLQAMNEEIPDAQA
ncbi:MAG TPA: chaperone NapD [Burkholderiaceae bacterium]|nr:chaperone NapD [Burkholderiaceae bacterium]